jgi:hypothetical protein
MAAPLSEALITKSRKLVAAALLALVLVLLPGSATASAAPALEGAAMHSLSNENYGDLKQELDAAQDLGASVVRIDINWAALEPVEQGIYTGWYADRIDRFMQGAKNRGIKVLATIHRTPCWASSAPRSVKQGCDPGWQERGVALYPPTKASAFASIARYIAARHRSALAGIEVWNEPNRPGFLTAADPAKAYVPLVKAAYPAIRSVAPEVKVLAGAISGANDNFLKQLYANGMKGYYDAISVHPYVANFTYGPETDWGAEYASYTFLPGLKLIRSTQAAASDKTPVWATEFGWHTGSARDAGAYNGVSEQTQADYLGRAFELLEDPASGLDFLEGAISYNLRDNGSDPDDMNANFGLLHRDFSEKPSFDAVRGVISG